MTEPTEQTQQHFYQAIGDIKGVLILDNPLSILKVGDSAMLETTPDYLI